MEKPMKLDIKNILRGSLIFTGVGIILVIMSMVLQLLSLIVTDANGEIVQLIVMGYSLILIPGFFVLYFFAGIRAVKVHGLDAVGAGAVAAFSYFVAGLTHVLLETLLNLLVVSGLIPGGAGFGSAGSIISAQIFGEVTGTVSVMAPAICGFGLLLIGTLINFVIGGFGGLFAQR